MKRKTTKEILAESFRELAEKKPVDKITVAAIAENCGYSSTTFYRHFSDKYDLMAWAYSMQLENILIGFRNELNEWRQTLLKAALFYKEQQEYLRNLFLHTGGYDSFIRYMKQIHYESLKKRLPDPFVAEKPDVKMEMYVRAYCQGTVELTCDWIMGKYEASPQELAEVYENLLPFPLQKYILEG